METTPQMQAVSKIEQYKLYVDKERLIKELSGKIHESEQYKNHKSTIFVRDEFCCVLCGFEFTFFMENQEYSKDQKMPCLTRVKRKGSKFESKIVFADIIKKMPKPWDLESALMYAPLWDTENTFTLCKQCYKRL